LTNPWASIFDEGEETIWQGRPDGRLFPERFKWLYMLGLLLTVGLWLSSPWSMNTPWDFWKLFLVTLGVFAVLAMDQQVRKARDYIVTNKHVWVMNRVLKTRRLPIDPYLKFSVIKRGVRFDSHPFFAFDHLTHPNAAISALNQAQEAS
jgi:hypothetical protein